MSRLQLTGAMVPPASEAGDVPELVSVPLDITVPLAAIAPLEGGTPTSFGVPLTDMLLPLLSFGPPQLPHASPNHVVVSPTYAILASRPSPSFATSNSQYVLG